MRRSSLTDFLVRGLFQLWAPTYDLSPSQVFLYRPVHRAVLRAVDRLQVSPDCVLDLGCGTARLTEDLSLRSAGARVVGVDRSSGMLRAARRRLGRSSPPLVEGDAYALPFGDGVFALVTSTFAYHWLLEPAAALGEIRRVLRPGGYLVLGTLVARLIPGVYLGMRLVTERRHREDLASAGFDVASSERVGGWTVILTARRPDQ